MEYLGIGVQATDGSTIVILRGEADLASRERLRAVLRVCQGEVVVDLSRTTFLDAASIGVFVSEQHRLAAQEGRLRLIGPTGIVERVLCLVGLASWIDTAAAPRASSTRTLASLD
jgi:anti-anti-sigma factor